MERQVFGLLRSGGIKASTTAAVALLGLASSAVLARAVTPTALGVFALVLAMVQIGTMLADGGTGLAATRFIAAAKTENQRRKIILSSARARFVATAATVCIAAALMPWLRNVLFHGQVSAAVYGWVLVWLASKSLFLLLPAIYRGRINWLAEGAVLILEAGGILIAYATMIWRPGDPSILPLRLAIVYLVLSLPLVRVLRRVQAPAAEETRHDEEDVTVRRLLGFGLPLVLNSSFFLLLTWTDRIMLGVMRAPDELAVYFVAANLSAAGRFLFGIPEQVLYSHLAATARRNDHDLPRVYDDIFRLFAVLGVLFVVLASAAGTIAIPLLYGANYEASVWPFQLLLVVLLVRILSIPASLFLVVVFEKTSETRDALGVAFLLNLLLNLWTIPRFGTSGAIMGSLTAFLAATFYLWWAVWRVARVRARVSDFAVLALPTALWLAVTVGAHFARLPEWLNWTVQVGLAGYLVLVAWRQLSRLGLVRRPSGARP